MTPHELQELINAKDFIKIAVNLIKLTGKKSSIKEIENTLSLYDEIPKLSNWNTKGSGYYGFSTAKFYLATTLSSIHNYEYVYYESKELQINIRTKLQLYKEYLEAIKSIFGW